MAEQIWKPKSIRFTCPSQYTEALIIQTVESSKQIRDWIPKVPNEILNDVEDAIKEIWLKSS